MPAIPPGTYSIPQLQPGIYDITVSKTGFVTHAVTGIRVLSSQTVRVDMKLDLGSMQQTVSVTGEVALIHTDTQTHFIQHFHPDYGRPAEVESIRSTR